MGDDLDQFIREQKAKLAADRNVYGGGEAHSNGADGNARPARKQWSKERVRDEEDGLVIPGLRDSYSARMRKQKERNEEYNEFLRQLKDSEQNRYSDKKPDRNPVDASPIKNPADQQQQRRAPDSPPPVARRSDLDRDIYDEYLREKDEDERRMERRRQIMRELEKENRKQRGLSDRKPAEPDIVARPSIREPLEPKKPEDDNFSLPIKDRLSAQQRMREERNREYNDFLRRKEAERAGGPVVDDRPVPRKGWGTPTYEEILDDKRREEIQYRRTSEEVPGLAEYQLRPAVSDGYLNRPIIDDDRYDVLDRMYEERKVRFRDDLLSRNHKPRTGLLDDDDWLDISRLDRRRGHKRDYDRELDLIDRQRAIPAPRVQTAGVPPLDLSPRQQTESRRAQVKSAPAQESGVDGASLPLADISEEEKRRRKEAYRLELLKQMDEAAQNKQRERNNQFAAVPTNARFPDSRQPPSAVRAKAPPPVAPALLQTRPLNIGGPSLGAYNSPLDDPYYYYGLQNPSNESEPPQAPIVPPVSLVGLTAQPSALSARKQVGFAEVPTEVFAPAGGRTPRKGPEALLPGAMPAQSEQEQAVKKRQEAQAYQQELERQIQENNRKKEIDRLEREKYERKLEEEIMNYNPYGKGGGGAPMKDRQGNVVADLRQIHVENEEKLIDPKKRIPSVEQPVVFSPRTPRDPNDHARGGHGIFGEPKSDAEKSAIDRYKDDLKKQIEEKKRVEEQKRLVEKLEEEKELKRIEEERLKIAREYEEEQRKLREKDENIRLQNEEIKRQAEEKREELKRRQQKERETVVRSRADDVHAKEERAPTRNGYQRANSPIVPALRTKNESRIESRADSADVLNQLANMRKQLQSERMRVESALGNQKYDVNVFDPRQVRPAPAINQPIVPLALIYDTTSYPVGPTSVTAQRSPDPQVFDTALHKGPVTVKRPAIEDKANSDAKAEFHKFRVKESNSKTGFRRNHPDSPVTATALETQQLAFLEEQEEALKRLRDGQPSNSFYPQRAGSTKSQLQADTAFLDLNGAQVPTKNESAREKRRQARGKTPSTSKKTPQPDAASMGSTTSIDPDRIDRKNADRMKKLNDLAADDVSLASAEPDDILDRFMSKQQYNRPPSQSTLDDDEAWMRPSADK